MLGLNIIASLDAGETAGLVTTLAQPNLTALSGETGEFLAGGEFPIPISSGLGSVSIEYKKYGVSLSFTPTVLADGRISLRVRPEVSELSSQGSVTLNGFSIPALTMRRAETSVELGSGQSMMLGGLLSNNSTNTITKLPGAGDVPILGNLFKSSAFKRGETELVIVVTPYLVRPVNDGDIKLPTDGLQNPDDVQRLFGNKMTDGVSGAKRPGPTVAPAEAAKAEAAPVAGKRATATNDNANPGFSLN
jgi:pilus assembly protein CpaC